ncbi:hypothetical protein NERG_00930 [Nematocida ausubeli]|uniref:Acyl-CoA thioesterase-like N-terminal HotDog domain-containing protein n=1 Tax=Nematocida ausubeli (strain ATCC PRA-371 / ERTm2) TaxID=1913371 RepID=H8ZBI1_NEMA1|nr:hypothetical protein NERG_00930 [Nematocida ausubeli]KAI5137769.1 hypothetical protein NEAUS06_2352 [Nematocida ausubeli]
MRGTWILFGTLKLSLFFVFCIAKTINIKTCTKIEKYSMETEVQNGQYMCTDPFRIEGRPVFGGQIFSHVIGCALKEIEGYDVVTAQCIFQDKTDPDLPIIYRSTDESLGKTVKMVKVEVLQEKDGVEAVRAVGTVLMQKNKSVIMQEKKKYIETIVKTQINPLSEYFSPGTTDPQKIKKMQTVEKYMESILKSKDDFEAYMQTAHKIYSGADVFMLRNKKCPFSRCVGYKLRLPKGEAVSLPKKDELNRVYTYLSFISDEYLLESSLIGKGMCIVNTQYNILTLSHSISFNNCEDFKINRPFFYTMWVDSIQNNMANCSGMIVQGQKVYANIKQTGKIIALSRG